MTWKEEDCGSASIEATISLVFFVFVVIGIYMLANFCIVQSKVANAVNATAKEMSQYAYFYHALGLDEWQAGQHEKAQKAVAAFEDLSEFIHTTEESGGSAFNELQEHPDVFIAEVVRNGGTEDTEALSAAINKLTDMFKEVKNNPVEFVRSMAALALSTGAEAGLSQLVAAPLAKSMARQHFGDTPEEANAYLAGKGVVDGYDGINFNLSTIFVAGDGSKNLNSSKVQIVAYYKMNLTNIIPNPLLNREIILCQRAVTDAWFGDE